MSDNPITRDDVLAALDGKTLTYSELSHAFPATRIYAPFCNERRRGILRALEELEGLRFIERAWQLTPDGRKVLEAQREEAAP